MNIIDLVITSNETKLIEKCKENQNIKKYNINLCVENLLIGDIIIRYNNEIIYIIERKAGGDLYASIKDGRYKEQKSRLISSGLNTKNIIYLLEDLHFINNTIEKILWSAISNTQFRDNMTIFQTKNIQESINYLINLCCSIQKFYIKPEIKDTTSNNKIVNINIKKTTINPDQWFKYSLTLIPKCSLNIAEKIFEKYPSIHLLIEEINKNGINCLSDITHGKSSRKLGKKLSNDICSILLKNF
jgi:ERCC4-type nuclease